MDDPRVSALFVACAALAIYATVVFVGLRLSRQRFALVLMIMGAVVVFGLVTVWALTRGMSAYWHFAAFFCCGVAITVFLYGAVLKSLSMRMLAALADAHGGTATTGQLANRIIRAAFAERIQLLEDARLIERVDGGYLLTPAGVSTAARIRRMQRMLKVESSPLYSA